ncbi:MAG: hypothetical protein E7307_01315 [Butyrivibrio sp.]|nr:hypothetical protein [Butyrivibrio sp.]
MSKRVVASLLVVLMILVCACGKNNTVSEDDNKSTALSDDKSAAEDVKSSNEEEKTQSIEVDENLLTVEITVPSSFIGETTQEDIDKSVKENGYVSGTLNSDGSVTYKMTKTQHKELVAKIKETIDTQMSEMVGSEDYPNIVSVEANDDYTNFTITTKSTELGLMESMSTLAFYMYGGMYNAFAGNKVDNIHVDFVNEASGQVIQSADSKNMGSN